jgi:MoxR-like ATPase
LDLPHTSGKKDQSKAWMNRLLETMTVPVIWTTNSIRAIDPATLRRFSLVLKMDEPPRSVKRRLAQQYLGGLNLPAAQLDAIASLTQLTPGHLEITARTVILAAPESPEQASTFVDQQLTNARRALGLPTLVRRRDTAITYDTRFVNIRGEPQRGNPAACPESAFTGGTVLLWCTGHGQDRVWPSHCKAS